jgi:hypothetical protein
MHTTNHSDVCLWYVPTLAYLWYLVLLLLVLTTVPSMYNCPLLKMGDIPWTAGYPMDHRNKTRFMHLYYSHSRLLQEALGSHFPPSSRNHMMIHMRPPLMTSPPPTCCRLPSPAVTRRRRCPPAVTLRHKKVSLTHSVGTGAGVTLC